MHKDNLNQGLLSIGGTRICVLGSGKDDSRVAASTNYWSDKAGRGEGGRGRACQSPKRTVVSLAFPRLVLVPKVSGKVSIWRDVNGFLGNF